MQPVNRQVQTLDEFTIQQLRNFPNATGELSNLLRNIGLAAKRINVEVNKAGLVDILGATGQVNVQGEQVQQLDLFAHDQFTGVLRHGISCAGVASEEMDEFMAFNDEVSQQSKYVCLYDPLDGSSNIDVNVSIGTIFSVYRRISPVGSPVVAEDFLQPGAKQIAAGYIVYGSSTMFVYATRRGMNGFTLDPSIGEFCLSHPNMHCPEDGDTYSVNHGNFFRFEKYVQHYINHCQQRANLEKEPYSQRYIGSMIADVHRILVKGGIFLYPGTTDMPSGKLRLQYEGNPFAFMAEVAGAVCTNGQQRLLDLVPEHLHQRTPFFVGSRKMMQDLEHFRNQDTGTGS